MPAVGDLESFGKRLAGGKRKAAGAISYFDTDLRLIGEAFVSIPDDAHFKDVRLAAYERIHTMAAAGVASYF